MLRRWQLGETGYPITQGEKFDPDGKFVARYVPELKNLPAKFIHRPWDLGPLDLRGMGLVLGKNYPSPIVEHSEGRARALAASARLKALRQKWSGPGIGSIFIQRIFLSRVLVCVAFIKAMVLATTLGASS